MLSEISQRLITRLSGHPAIEGDFRAILFGTPKLLPTIMQPCLLLTLKNLSKVSRGDTQGHLAITFQLFGYTSYLETNEQAVSETQDLLWRYEGRSDRGVYPALLDLQRGIIFEDSMHRSWAIKEISEPKFYSEKNSNNNTLGAFLMDITLESYLKR